MFLNILGPIGLPEIALILGLALLLFGPKKIPEIARSLGRGLREFKQNTSGLVDSINEEINNAPPTKKPVSSLPRPQAPEATSTQEIGENPTEIQTIAEVDHTVSPTGNSAKSSTNFGEEAGQEPEPMTIDLEQKSGKREP